MVEQAKYGAAHSGLWAPANDQLLFATFPGCRELFSRGVRQSYDEVGVDVK